jgi:hypothetical protein
MPMKLAPDPTEEYFWTKWTISPTFTELVATFSLLSFTDLLATLRMLQMGVKEGNAVANWFLMHFGPPGLIVYKLLLVGLILGIAAYIHRQQPVLARRVLWGAILTMGVIALLHVAIIAGIASWVLAPGAGQ